MESITIETLRRANRTLCVTVNRLSAWRNVAAAIRAEGFSTLRTEIARAATVLRDLPADSAENPELGKAISDYREHLQQLAGTLPLIHGALQVRRERLRAALDRLHTIEAWAEANRKSL